jgi:phage gp29-like protein
MAILDARGNPIERKTLAEPQTARMASLHQEFADHPARGLTPQRLHSIMTSAEQGDLTAQSDLFEDMEERDTQIFADMSKRKRALLTIDWRIDPPPNASAAEKALAEYAKAQLDSIADLEDVILDALTAIGHGFSCLEMTWGKLDGDLMPEKIEHRPQAWFTVDQATRSQIRLKGASMDGEPLNPFGWIMHQHKSRSGYIARSGLFRVLVWPYLFRNYSARDMAEFLEIYGLPLRLGKYPANATQDERRTLLNAVVNIGHAAAGIIPEGMLIEFQEAAKGQHDPFMAMIDWCERSVSKAILGQNVGHDSASKGSLAGSEVDNEVRKDLLKSDARQLQGTLTRDLIYPILAVNKGLGDIRRCPRLVFDFRDVEDLGVFAESLPKLVGIGMHIPAKWAHEKLSIPEPIDGEDVLTVGTSAPPIVPPAAEPAPVAPAKAALKFTPLADVTPSDTNQLADVVESAAAPALQDMLEQIRTLAEKADSLEQLRDWLLDAYGELDSSKMAQVMATGLGIANLTGRYDVAASHGMLPD